MCLLGHFCDNFHVYFISCQSCRGKQRTMFAPPKLTAEGVFTKLKDIAMMTGHSVSIDSCSCLLLM